MNKKTIISLVLGCISVLPASAQNGWFVEAGGFADYLLERCQQAGFRQAPHSVIHYWRGQVDHSGLRPASAGWRLCA